MLIRNPIHTFRVLGGIIHMRELLMGRKFSGVEIPEVSAIVYYIQT